MKKKKEKINISEEIAKSFEELLLNLQVEAKVAVNEIKDEGSKDESEGGNYIANIETSESGLLIGHHGETINSLQLLIGVILFKKLGKWVRVLVDVGDYRKMREESIKEMVNRIIAEVEQTGRGVELPYLSPLERRIVHMMLSENEKMMSESTGEGKDRRVMIKPR